MKLISEMPVSLSNSDKMDLLRGYYLNNRNQTMAIEWYRNEFPFRETPSRRTLDTILNNLLTYGRFAKPQQKRSHIISRDVEINVLCFVESFPDISTRRIATELDISQRSVMRI